MPVRCWLRRPLPERRIGEQMSAEMPEPLAPAQETAEPSARYCQPQGIFIGRAAIRLVRNDSRMAGRPETAFV